MTGSRQKVEPHDHNSGTDDGLSRDELFHILSNHRRRFVLHQLKYESQPVKVGDLITRVAAWENGVSPEEVTSKQRRRVYNSLHQTHLPKLDEAGIIDYDRDEIELTGYAERLDVYLDVVPEGDVSWAKYYLTLALVQIGALAAVALDVAFFGNVPDSTAAPIFAIALLISAVAYYYDQNRTRVGGRETPPEVKEL